MRGRLHEYIGGPPTQKQKCAESQKTGEINEPEQGYTLEKPKKGIDFKIKPPEQVELPFGKKSDSVSRDISATRRRMAIPTTGSEL